MPKVVVDGRFNGPPGSGNGGYVCGVLGSAVAGPAVSTLRKPPPLGRELDLRIGADGQVELIDGEQPIGTAVPRELTIEVPEAPSFDTAVEAYVVTASEIGQEGRKHWSGCAVYDEDGVPCAMGSATWILLDDSQQQDFRVGG